MLSDAEQASFETLLLTAVLDEESIVSGEFLNIIVNPSHNPPPSNATSGCLTVLDPPG